MKCPFSRGKTALSTPARRAVCGLFCLNKESGATQVTQGPYAVEFEHMHADDYGEGIGVVVLFPPAESWEFKHRVPTANFEYFWEKVGATHPLSGKIFERLGT